LHSFFPSISVKGWAMSGYLLVRVNITDTEQYQEYMKLTPAVIAEFGGKFIVRGGDRLTLEGPDETHRVVLIEFPNYEAVQKFYNSKEYQSAARLRANAADAQFIALDGV